MKYDKKFYLQPFLEEAQFLKQIWECQKQYKPSQSSKNQLAFLGWKLLKQVWKSFGTVWVGGIERFWNF